MTQIQKSRKQMEKSNANEILVQPKKAHNELQNTDRSGQ